MKFYWNGAEPYPIDPSKRYLIYYVGCFCPPHIGHFEVVSEFVGNENVKILLSQYGNEGRHGVPFNVSKGMWKRYLKTLSPEEQKRVVLEKLRSTFDVVRHMKGVDVVVYIKGNEEPHLQTEKNEQNKHVFAKFEKSFLKERHRLLEIAKKFNADVDFQFRKRNDWLSATKFIAAVKERRDIEEMKKFFPSSLPEKDMKRILKKLRKQNLKIEK